MSSKNKRALSDIELKKLLEEDSDKESLDFNSGSDSESDYDPNIEEKNTVMSESSESSSDEDTNDKNGE